MDIKDYIIRHSIGHVYWKNCDGYYLGCNEAFAKLLKLNSPADIIGKTDADFLPDYLQYRIYEIDKLIIETGKERIVEEVGIDANGNPALYMSKKVPIRDENNQVTGIIATSIDVTENLSIKNYILHHTTGILYWKDIHGRYIGCNEYYARLCGLNSTNQIIGKSDYDLHAERLGPEYIKKIIDIDQEVINGGGEKIIEEIGVDKNGNLTVYLTKKVPLKDKNNKTIGLVGNSIDISKQKQAEVAKNEFLRNMSHDIMTSFTGILGISQLLYQQENDQEKKQTLSYVIQSSEKLLHLLKEILELTELGGKCLEASEFNVHDLIQEVVDMLSSSAIYKGLSLSFVCDDRMIKSDRMRVSRILINLVSNAIKFTEKGSIFVEARFEDGLHISVKDTGIGIPSDKKEVIFEKFKKLTESAKDPRFLGVGIGLYLAKNIAEELGGHITVSSELGVGSIFTFSLPI